MPIPEQPGASVTLDAVSRMWGTTTALACVSVHVPAGTFCVLLGPSGCGKTTCLRIVAGLEQADTGRVRIGGRDVTGLPPARRGVAMVFQSYALFPHLTVAENVVFGLRARHVATAERARRLERAVEILGIGHLLQRRPGQLSGGQQQRVALGRAIVAEAPVCLMDEPLSNLDAQLRAEMRREILALQRRLGMTMLYVTHDQTEAMGMADQVVLLRDGHIEQDAPPAEMYARPATSFAARFIGTPPMNLIPLESDGTIAGLRLAPAGTGERLLGVRPEALRLASSGLPGHVLHSEYMGADTTLACAVGSARVLARLPGRVVLPEGSAVHLAAEPADLHCFDAATGRRARPSCNPREDFGRMIATRRTLLGAAAATLAAPAVLRAQGKTTIEFYFPVAVGGPITKLIDAYVADFEKDNPDIAVRPIYAGSYVDTLTKAVTATKAGQGPALAVCLAVDAYSLADDELIVPFDSVAADADGKAWLAGFYPAFMRNGRIDGHDWGIPFQRSTIVLYWNKDAFREAGLDPERPPQTWAEHAEYAEKVTRRDGDRVTRWGVQIPGTGFTYWLYQGLVAEAGAELANANGTKVDFENPACVEALQYWIDLTAKYKAHPPGIVDWGTTPRDFLEGRAAMIWTTTGNLSNIKANARFPFGVGMLPAQKRRGSPTGGGNFHMFKGANPAQQAAAVRFLKWLTSPERAARWGIDTGYVATRPDAWETDAMKAYVAGFPAAAVARDQLQYAVAELSTHDNQRVTQVLDDQLQAALLGQKQPRVALAEAQAGASRILRPFAR